MGFWGYHSFITASAKYEPYGFGTTYLNSSFFGTKEVVAFLAHVGTKTSCEYYLIKESLSWEILIWVFVLLVRLNMCMHDRVRVRESEGSNFVGV